MLFPIGKVTVKKRVLEDDRIEVPHLVEAFSRYIRGDWGDLDHSEAIANDVALTSGGRVEARYRVDEDASLTMSTEDGVTIVELRDPELLAGPNHGTGRALG